MLTILHFISIFAVMFVFFYQGAYSQQQQNTNPYETPTPPPSPPPPVQTPQYYVTPQLPQQQSQIPLVGGQTYVQPVPTNAGGSSVDLGTLMTILTPVLGGIAGLFIKNRKDMEKSDKQVEQTTKQQIDQVLQKIYPALQQNAAVANQTAKQDVKLNEVTNLLYKIMGDKANEIQGLPEIQQVNLLRDAIQSEMIAKQYQQQLQNIPTNTNVTTITPTTTNQNQKPATTTTPDNTTNPYS